MRKAVLKDHPWPSTITIVVGSPRELERFLARHADVRDGMADCRGRHAGIVTARGRRDFIAVKLAYRRSDRICTLTHEAVHLARSLLGDYAEMPLTEESDEAYAYFVSWIVEKGLRIL